MAEPEMFNAVYYVVVNSGHAVYCIEAIGYLGRIEFRIGQIAFIGGFDWFFT